MATKGAPFDARRFEDLFVVFLGKCKSISELKKFHARTIVLALSQSSYLATKMVDICDAKEDVPYASLLFNQIKEPTTYLFNALIRTYTHNHWNLDAIHLYQKMLKHPQAENPLLPDRFTFPFVVKSSAELGSLDLGKQFHGHVYKIGAMSNTETENALMTMYTNFHDTESAQEVFDKMPQRNPISWNILISGYARAGKMRRARAVFEEAPEKTIVSWTSLMTGYSQISCYGDAIDIFRRMQLTGIYPDFVSIVAILPACAELGALELGKWLHFVVEREGYLRYVPICNALIEMYAKCGRIDQALQVFDGMPEKDVVSWSTVISGLSAHGKAIEVIEVFDKMQEAGVLPNRITFLSLLSACAHAGLLHPGLTYFESMQKDHGIEPEIEHYGCLIDLLGRSGCLRQALDVINGMPLKADAAIWGSLLSSCRTYRNPEIAGVAMEHLIELEPDEIGNYVMLSNIYAGQGRWEIVSRMRKAIRSKRSKIPGCSSIEVDDKVEEFLSSDDGKPFSTEIYEVIEHMSLHQNEINEMLDELRNE